MPDNPQRTARPQHPRRDAMRKLLSIHNVTAMVVLAALAGCAAGRGGDADLVPPLQASVHDGLLASSAATAPADSAVAVAPAPSAAPATKPSEQPEAVTAAANPE